MPDRIDRAGQPFGDYRLSRRLGGGGFGDVYLGEHIRTQEQVAVKVLQGRLTEHKDLKEFINEARTFRLKHPHILPLLDFGIAGDDVPYLVMEYASNGTLRDRHPKGTRVSLAMVVSYVTPLAEALFYAHEQHLIHRDVKPENMLLAADNRLLLSDFGIATVAQSSHLIDALGGIGGTLPYMAPEQLQGKPRPASDQYALAIVTYELLTGIRPFSGTQAELVTQHLTMPPPSLRMQIPELSIEIEQVVLTALAKDPKARFDTVEAFAQAFTQAAHLEQTADATTFIPGSQMIAPPTPSPATSVPPIPSPATPVIEGIFGGATPSKEGPLVTEPVPPTTTAPIQSTSPSSPRGITSSAKTSIATPPAADSLASLPVRPRRIGLPKRVISILLVLLALLMISASIIFTTNTTNTFHANSTATAQGATATVTTSINAYKSYTDTNGMAFGFDAQHTHVNPFEKILNSMNVSRLVKSWSIKIGKSVSSPIVINNLVYIGTDNGFYAIDATTGAKKWTFGSGRISMAAFANSTIYTGTSDYPGSSRTLYAINANTGKRQWDFTTASLITSAPTVVNGIVYIGTQDNAIGNFYAIDASKGTQKWIFGTGSDIYYPPAVVNGVVYIGSLDSVYAIDAIKGTLKWHFDAKDYFLSSPSVINGIVYIGSRDKNFYALDAVTGEQKWAYYLGSSVEECSAALTANTAYVGSNDNLYAFDISKRTIKWKIQTDTSDGLSSPIIANGVVYFSSYNSNIYAIDASTGTIKWKFPTGGVFDSPMIVNGVVYIGSSSGDLYAFSLPKSA